MRHRTLFRELTVLALLAAALAMPGAAIAATSQSGTGNGTVARSYNAGNDVLSGMIVELKAKDKTTVMPLKSEDLKNMAGVVVPVADANLVLTPPTATSQQVLVAAAGRYQLLVSNQSGGINPGDYLTISALDGIAMKAGTGDPEVIGQAINSFDGKTNVVDTQSLKNTLGQTKTVAIGYIPVEVRLAPNPFYRNSNNLPGFLARAATNIVHKPVTAFRVYISIGILLCTLFIAGSMFYGGIRGGIIAIGRNPLAKNAIGRGLFRAVLFGLIVLVIGAMLSYVILL